MSDELEIYNKVLRGYSTVVRCAMGTLPMSSMTDAHWRLVGRGSSGAIVLSDMSSTSLWRLLAISMSGGDIQHGKRFKIEGYLTFIFFAERFLRSVSDKDKNAKLIAEYLRWLTSWNGALWQHRYQKDFGGLQFSLWMALERSSDTWSRMFQNKPEMLTSVQLSPTTYSAIASFFHPAVFDDLLLSTRSPDDDESFDTPRHMWGDRAIDLSLGGKSKWVPTVLGDNGNRSPRDITSWDLRGAVFDRCRFPATRFYFCDFSNVSIQDCQIEEAEFYECKFVEVGIGHSKFDRCSFRSCAIHGAMVSLCNFYGTKFYGGTKHDASAHHGVKAGHISESHFGYCHFDSWPMSMSLNKGSAAAPSEFAGVSMSSVTFASTHMPNVLFRSVVADGLRISGVKTSDSRSDIGRMVIDDCSIKDITMRMLNIFVGDEDDPQSSTDELITSPLRFVGSDRANTINFSGSRIDGATFEDINAVVPVKVWDQEAESYYEENVPFQMRQSDIKSMLSTAKSAKNIKTIGMEKGPSANKKRK